MRLLGRCGGASAVGFSMSGAEGGGIGRRMARILLVGEGEGKTVARSWFWRMFFCETGFGDEGIIGVGIQSENARYCVNGKMRVVYVFYVFRYGW